jgi:uncharacterized delta-60 repeat protein
VLANGPALARYNANGTLDTSFGSGGVVSTTVGPALVIQADGKIVLEGAGLARYNPDGSIDTTFGTGGIAPNFINSSWSVAIAPNGDIVEAGYVGGNFAVARYLPSAPQIGSFTASPNPVTAGGSVTLTAANLTDGNPGSTVTQVAFYLDSNGDGILEPGTDTLLGYGTRSGGTWTLTFSTAGWASAVDRLFAQAEDSYGVFGDPFALDLTVL